MIFYKSSAWLNYIPNLNFFGVLAFSWWNSTVAAIGVGLSSPSSSKRQTLTGDAQPTKAPGFSWNTYHNTTWTSMWTTMFLHFLLFEECFHFLITSVYSVSFRDVNELFHTFKYFLDVLQRTFVICFEGFCNHICVWFAPGEVSWGSTESRTHRRYPVVWKLVILIVDLV